MRVENKGARSIHSGASIRGYAFSPKMHQGGLVMFDGDYELAAGEHVTPEGRNHPMNQKAVDLETKASGPNVDDAEVTGGKQKVWRAKSNAHNSPAKAIEIKAKELRDGESDFRALKCPSSMCNCNSCQDARRK
jgi:hypothetical protein